jgi:FtsZ-binding cell division protein ZapB
MWPEAPAAPTITAGIIGEKDFAMSNELITALENRVTTAVDTIEGLRSEVRVLKEERQLLESKLRELLQKIEGVDAEPAEAGSAAETGGNASAQPTQGAGYGFSSMGVGHSPSEY